ncbi:MAG: clan AA aspartic protease [Planctomycetia bacterium]|nr:clan AA aspartic protease [Planctomycetia bacterium]
MGLVYTRISLSNPREPALAPMEVSALADTGALLLCVPQHVAVQLKLQELYQREVTIADGKRQLCPYVGPVHVTFGNRGCFVGALVLGDEVLLGAVPMEDMDLVVCPATRSVAANPNSPNFPSAVVKPVQF